MRKVAITSLIAVMVLTGMAMGAPALISENDAKESVFSSGVILGYNSGFKIQPYGMISNFARGFPMNARLSIGYAFTQPGNAVEARKIFINNNTNGIPEDKGRVWDFRLDLMYPIDVLSLERAFIVGGPRHARFKGNFKYVGGNEDFDVISNHWGIGSGIESYFGMSQNLDLVLSGGIDYYFGGTLTGHDTSYSPDGEVVNPREEYTYSDADKAIDQPKFEFSIMFGFNYGF